MSGQTRHTFVYTRGRHLDSLRSEKPESDDLFKLYKEETKRVNFDS
jgi:hypothetical protein